MVPQGPYNRFVSCCNGVPLKYSPIHVVTSKICLKVGGHRMSEVESRMRPRARRFLWSLYYYMPTCTGNSIGYLGALLVVISCSTVETVNSEGHGLPSVRRGELWKTAMVGVRRLVCNRVTFVYIQRSSPGYYPYRDL